MNRSALVFGGMLLTMDVYAASYVTTQITDNLYWDEYAKINDQGDVVWTAWVNANDPGWTVFKYEAASGATKQLSGNNVFFDSHRMNNRGDVVWMESDGNDQEIFLYRSSGTSAEQLTVNDFDDTEPQVSDNGDVAWFEQRGVNTGAFVYRYDAQNNVVQNIDFPGASRQGMLSINAVGDIAWNAEVTMTEMQDGAPVPVTYSQEILVFTAATASVANITQSQGAIDSNQRLLDNGDVVWEAYDELTGATTLKRYQAAATSVSDISTDYVNGFSVGSQGHVAWFTESATGAGTQYTLHLFNPVSGSANTISSEVLARAPFLDGVSSRGDVVWRSITNGVAPNWFSNHYNAVTNAIVILTATQGFWPYELAIADNGDAVWSLSDGNDYEVYSYQADSGATSRLSDNTVDDGIISVNASGNMVWHRFDLDDSELVIALKTETPPPELNIDVVYARYNPRTLEANLKSRFSYDAIPAATDVIRVQFDDATLLNVVFSDFTMVAENVYKYSTAKIEARIDFSKGVMLVSKQRVNPASVNMRDGVDVEIQFGTAVAADHFGK